ncbi:MAG TPA: UxaA family hydrolase [Opitutaceae bacterium]|nr:UxaA family hydrolase [Opitutaceae bacterium]
MPSAPDFSSVSRLPAATDNVAIATRRLEAGTELLIAGVPVKLKHTVLLGHRFAVQPVKKGAELLSWTRPFGVAIADIAPGDYVCNREMLEALAIRDLNATLPAAPNFENRIVPYAFDEGAFMPAPPVERVSQPATFLGYRRPGRRGVGTRNYIVILGTSSRTASFARLLADRLRPLAGEVPSLDGIVALAHTEGGDPEEPNNAPELLRALAGYLVHPNVAAVLAVDYGAEPLNNARLSEFAERGGYPLADVPHRFLTIRHGVPAALAEGEAQVRAWLPAAAAARRTPEPLAGLSVALQCGGSDAFSGISGNPLAGAVAHEVVRHGGRAVLTETDELIGAEGYILSCIKDLDTGRRFLRCIERFKERLTWHGASPEGNPSGGNKLRGLYNIVLKSLGAAAKKAPATRVESVFDYAEPLSAPGFHFMNGPGNDLEGIAGQVATGCNVVIFVTGNGSITNFPFVPTIKVTTTTARHELLINEMDVNAGRYLDGTPMDILRDETFDLLREVASGRRTHGEHAGHAQISLWRNWRQTDTSHLAALRARPAPDGRPLALVREKNPPPAPTALIPAIPTAKGWALDRIGLIFPSSLCSSEIARLAAQRLNAKGTGRAAGFSRFVALTHTEGCGFGGESHYHLLDRVYRGYAAHPDAALTLFLEHGCEKVPNDMIRRRMEAAGDDPRQFGWASVQLDGGIEKVLAKVEAWFEQKCTELGPPVPGLAGLEALTLGLVSTGAPRKPTAEAFARLARTVVEAGGSVLVPADDPLLAAPRFAEALLGAAPPRPTLAYGQARSQPGLHVVDTETLHWTENLSGLGACGAQLFLALVFDHPRQGHPMIPLIQVAEAGEKLPADEIDLFLPEETAAADEALLRLVSAAAAREITGRAQAQGMTDFQITRGHLGVTT